jgi:hypothetical protein
VLYSAPRTKTIKIDSSVGWGTSTILVQFPDIPVDAEAILKILITRSGYTESGQYLGPTVNGLICDLWKDYENEQAWNSLNCRRFLPIQNSNHYFIFESQGETRGYFLDSLDFDIDTNQYNTDSLIQETRRGIVQWEEVDLIEVNPNQLTKPDLPVIRTKQTVRRAIGIKALPKKMGVRKTPYVARYLTGQKAQRLNNNYPWLYNFDEKRTTFDITYWIGYPER